MRKSAKSTMPFESKSESDEKPSWPCDFSKADAKTRKSVKSTLPLPSKSPRTTSMKAMSKGRRAVAIGPSSRDSDAMSKILRPAPAGSSNVLRSST